MAKLSVEKVAEAVRFMEQRYAEPLVWLNLPSQRIRHIDGLPPVSGNHSKNNAMRVLRRRHQIIIGRENE